MAGHLNVEGLAANTTPAPVAKVKYQRTTKGRKSQKVNLMLAAAAEDLSPISGATSPLLALQHQQQRGGFGPPSAGQHGMVGSYGHGMGGGPFMEGGGGGGFPHHFYNHSMQEGSPPSYYGGGEGHQHLIGGGHGMRGLPSFEQDFMRGQHQQQQGHQQQQRPFYTTAGMTGGGGLGGGGMKQHSMDPHEQDYDALHRQHLSPTGTVITGGGVLKSDPNNNCDFSEMRMFNGGGGIKSEFTSEDQPVSSGGGRMSSPMTNTNATTPEDVLEEL